MYSEALILPEWRLPFARGGLELMAANFRPMEGHSPCSCFLLANMTEDSIQKGEQTRRRSSSMSLDAINPVIERLL
jgi:hypothetical protein